MSNNLRQSFFFTNCIESILSQVEQYTQRIDYWCNGSHIQRWVDAGLLEVEPRLRKVRGWRYLIAIRNKIKEGLQIKEKNECSVGESLVDAWQLEEGTKATFYVGK